MKSLQDALYNWLSIKVVADARPNDQSAKDTCELFKTILIEDHGVGEIQVEKSEVMYQLSFVKDDKEKTTRFPVELIDIMVNQMEEEPEKFPNYNIKK